MRLLNVHTFKLHEFIGNDIPPYAILSHRWEDEEVTFQALQAGDGPEMKGWKKIEGCCRQAVADHFVYVWIDSCCIDKSSSSELSEAINSMFSWYQDAESCYAYLSDVCFNPDDSIDDSITDDRIQDDSDSDPEWNIRDHLIHINSNPTGHREFHASKWFTRGWTLQELLAPDILIFFDKNWKRIGTRESLKEDVSAITGIQDLSNFDRASIAQRFSWASKRETTRVEDTAYCLMGLFGVNMALLYGEGDRAFLRLQLEILKISNDETIFAWTDQWETRGGLLAPNPACFKNSTDIVCVHPRYIPRRPFTMTNNGLELDAKLIPTDGSRNAKFGQEYLCPLNCVEKGSGLALLLSDRARRGEQHLSRISCGRLYNVDLTAITTGRNGKLESRTIFVQQPNLSLRSIRRRDPLATFQFDTRQLSASGIHLQGRYLQSPKHGHWICDTIDRDVLKLTSRSTALMLFSRDRLSLLVQISCNAVFEAKLGLQVWRAASTTPDIKGLLGKTPIPTENWSEACSLVDYAAEFGVGKSSRFSENLHSIVQGRVVVEFEERFPGRLYFVVTLTLELDE